jgi:hypothetical protein
VYLSTEFEFHKEKYLSLRKEIDQTLVEFSQLSIYCVTAIAAVCSWAATQSFPSLIGTYLVWCIGGCIPIFSALEAYAKSKYIDRIGDYIRLMENDHIPSDKIAKGWEHFHDENSNGELTAVDIVFWVFLIIFTCIITVLGAMFTSP